MRYYTLYSTQKNVCEVSSHVSLLSTLMRVEMILRHVLYVSYFVPASRVRPLVPDVLPLAIVGRDGAFVSVVIMQSTGVRFTPLPFLRFTYSQVNLRTYVTDPHSGNQAVYFLNSGVTSLPISLLVRTIHIPWEHISFDLKVKSDDHRHYVSYEASGHWRRDFSITAEETTMPLAQMPPFSDTQAAIDYLVRPLLGFFTHHGQLRRVSIRHQEVTPLAGQVHRFHFPILDSLNVVEKAMIESPHSVFFVPCARFYIYMTRVPVTLGQSA